MIPERRSCVRHNVHGPVFASFDGVTRGFILDLSEQGMAMQTVAPVEVNRRVKVQMSLSEANHLETTCYVAWADALGRAGVRFSELPEETRRRLEQRLASNSSSPSRRAPKLTLSEPVFSVHGTDVAGDPTRQPWAISLESETRTSEIGDDHSGATMEYEFRSLGSDLPAALRLISERARSLEETLTVHRLRVPAKLRRTLASTNVIESAFSIVETVCRNVKRWRAGDQIERWVGSGLLVAERQFRKVQGYREIPSLLSSLANAAAKKAVAPAGAVA